MHSFPQENGHVEENKEQREGNFVVDSRKITVKRLRVPWIIKALLKYTANCQTCVISLYEITLKLNVEGNEYVSCIFLILILRDSKIVINRGN